MIDGFDYEEFAKSLKEQAEDVLPDDIPAEHQEYIINTMYNFVLTAGEALCSDSSLDFNMDDAVFICQVIAEWVFHKGVDLSRSGIDSKHWDLILQKIAFAIFEVTKQGIQRKFEQQDTLYAVEHHVNKVYKESIDELLERKEISFERAEFAKGLSNIDKMANETQEENDWAGVNNEAANKDTPKAQSKLEKYADKLENYAEYKCKKMKEEFESSKLDFKKYPICMTCAFFTAICGIKFLVNKGAQISNVSILNKIAVLMTFKNLAFILGIITFCGIVYHLLKRWQIRQQLRKLENISQEIQDLVNPDKQYKRLGADDIGLQVGKGLLCIADPDEDGTLLAEVAALRQRLTDDLGYIIPNVHIQDSASLDYYEFSISVRGSAAAGGFVYPDKIMVLEDEWERIGFEVPENAILGTNPAFNKSAIWVDEIETENIKAKYIEKLTPVKYIRETLKTAVIRHVDEILSVEEVKKYMDTAKEMFKSPDIIDDVLKKISLYDIKKIFVNLIREAVSIKDIKFLVEKLGELAEQTKDPDELAEMLRMALKRQISLSMVSENRVMYAVTLSPKWEKRLEESLMQTEFGIRINLNPDEIQELLEITSSTLLASYEQYGKTPVVLCSHKIRLPLYRFLVQNIPTVVVIAYPETIPDIKVENCGIIGGSKK